jgi:hypothetical protein
MVESVLVLDSGHAGPDGFVARLGHSAPATRRGPHALSSKIKSYIPSPAPIFLRNTSVTPSISPSQNQGARSFVHSDP